MKIKVLWVGKTQEEWIRRGIEEYAERIRRYCRLDISEAREEKGGCPEVMLDREGERLARLLTKNSRLILLDEHGEETTSRGLAKLLERYRDSGVPELTFAIGGAYGVGDAFRARADRTVSLSRMTFTHQMVRIFLLEQIYRGFTILNNEQYHH